MPVFTSPWATRRQILYFLIVLFCAVAVLAVPAFYLLYAPANCFDGKRNADEQGVDCGGSCALLCPHQVSAPVVHWARSFKVRDGVYSALAYVENQNISGGTDSVGYTFEFYDSANRLIGSRVGETYMPPQYVVPVFEGRIELDEEPARTFFRLDDSALWHRMLSRRGSLIVRNQSLRDVDKDPRLSADVENSSPYTFKDVELVAIVYDERDNAAAISRTSIDTLLKDERKSVVFTWPGPFPTRVERCALPADVAVLMDISGSMNDDATEPPQPLTDSKNAAASFIDRMSLSDRVDVVSFATGARLVRGLTENIQDARQAMLSLAIPPEEESGSTNIGEAIMLAREDLLNVSNGNDMADKARQRAIVLLTDGRANMPEDPGGEEYALAQGDEAKRAGVDIYTIGLGESVNADFLRSLASSAEASFMAVDSGELEGIYSKLSESLCERGPAIVDIIPISRDLIVPVE